MASAKDVIREYLGYTGVDHQKRTLDETLAWDDYMLESTHDFIQWWFPLTERSAFNTDAPIAALADFEDLATDELVRLGVERAASRMLCFYGLRLETSRVVKIEGDWERRSKIWARDETHHDLRITRILKSLVLLGHRDYAQAFLSSLEEIMTDERINGGEVPLRFWRNALS